MRATTYGWEMVCPSPIGRGPSSYGERGLARGDERLARDLAHRRQHERVTDAARGELPLDHAAPCRPEAHGRHRSAHQGEECVLAEGRHPERPGARKLGARLCTDHDIVSPARDTVRHAPAPPPNLLGRLLPRRGTQGAGQDERLARERALPMAHARLPCC